MSDRKSVSTNRGKAAASTRWFYNCLSKAMRLVRNQRQLDVAEFAKRLDKPEAAIHALDRGTWRPTALEVLQIAQVLDIAPQTLLHAAGLLYIGKSPTDPTAKPPAVYLTPVRPENK